MGVLLGESSHSRKMVGKWWDLGCSDVRTNQKARETAGISRAFLELGIMDSTHDYLIQSQSCYRYTNPQRRKSVLATPQTIPEAAGVGKASRRLGIGTRRDTLNPVRPRSGERTVASSPWVVEVTAAGFEQQVIAAS